VSVVEFPCSHPARLAWEKDTFLGCTGCGNGHPY
jgi:hypothetical protein